MKEVKYDDFQKKNILIEKITEGSTIRSICNKYKITPPTFYAWKTKFGIELEIAGSNPISSEPISSIEKENKILKRLYINLSAHNCELAKFLES